MYGHADATYVNGLVAGIRYTCLGMGCAMFGIWLTTL
jgi:hypothetical protein